MKTFLVLLGVWALTALFSYWWGRIVLPEMGLTAPGYMTWFWGWLPLLISMLLGAVIKELRTPAGLVRR